MRKYNTKEQNYKEWLRLNRILNEFEWTDEKSKEEADIEKVLDNPKFRKFNRWYSNPPKWYVNIFNRSDRKHNKQALKLNVKMMRDGTEEHPMDEDINWEGDDNFGDYWESERINYRFSHRNCAKWYYW